MKKLAKSNMLSMQPIPKTLVSCRDKEGRNNALVVGFAANVSLDPAMVMVGIVPSRFSYQVCLRGRTGKDDRLSVLSGR